MSSSKEHLIYAELLGHEIQGIPFYPDSDSDTDPDSASWSPMSEAKLITRAIPAPGGNPGEG